jgi:hypothetical protein
VSPLPRTPASLTFHQPENSPGGTGRERYRARMSSLKFSPDSGSGLKAAVTAGPAAGRYLIVDYGREGFDATFTTAAGVETQVPPLKGGRFHGASRHAIAACQEHHRRLIEAVV